MDLMKIAKKANETAHKRGLFDKYPTLQDGIMQILGDVIKLDTAIRDNKRADYDKYRDGCEGSSVGYQISQYKERISGTIEDETADVFLASLSVAYEYCQESIDNYKYTLDKVKGCCPNIEFSQLVLDSMFIHDNTNQDLLVNFMMIAFWVSKKYDFDLEKAVNLKMGYNEGMQ